MAAGEETEGLRQGVSENLLLDARDDPLADAGHNPFLGIGSEALHGIDAEDPRPYPIDRDEVALDERARDGFNGTSSCSAGAARVRMAKRSNLPVHTYIFDKLSGSRGPFIAR